MAEILFKKAKCAECEKDLPALSVAEVIQDDFIVCTECNEQTEAGWEEFQEVWAKGLL